MITSPQAAPDPAYTSPATGSVMRTRPVFRTVYWLLVPLLAVLAYITAIRVGFLKDDLQFLSDARSYGFDIGRLLSKDAQLEYGLFYRPVGTVLTWRLGWQLWGSNPFPYHLESVLIHAGTALLVGLWLAQASGRRALGWLAGALFGVWPLHTEAVAWLSAQWDALSLLFGMASLILFTHWWQGKADAKPRWPAYAGALALYVLALYTKESMLPFIAMFALAALYSSARFGRREWLRLVAGLASFVAVLLVVLALRFAFWGQVGGYQWAGTDLGAFLWDHLIEDSRLMLAPLNPAVVGAAANEIAGTIASIMLLTGLALYGSREKRTLALGGCWMLLALVPSLNLRVSLTDLHNNRFLYVASAGFCMALAALIYRTVVSLQGAGAKRVGLVLVGALLAGCCVVTWVQLRPWHTLTVMVDELDRSMLQIIPPSHEDAPVWYTENRPFFYKGAPGVGLFLGFTRGEAGTVRPDLVQVGSALGALQNIAAEKRDAFTMKFAPDTGSPHFQLDYVAGITNSTTPPVPSNSGSSLIVWNFATCDAGTLQAWKVSGATASCVPGTGLRLAPAAGTQMEGPGIRISPTRNAGPAIRLRAAVRYPGPAEQITQRWYWAQGGQGFVTGPRALSPARQDQNSHVYWTFLQASDLTGDLQGLRFEPGNTKSEADILWLAVDTLP